MRRFRIIFVVVTVVIITVLGYLWYQGREQDRSVPILHLESLEPAVAGLIQGHLR